MKKLKKFFDNLKAIWNLPNKERQDVRDIVLWLNQLDNKIGERTTIHADIGYKGTGSQIIVVGRYRNRDYVRSFNVMNSSLDAIINMLKNEEQNSGVGKFDMVGGSMEFSAVYDRDRF
jgi:hypothetical protein